MFSVEPNAVYTKNELAEAAKKSPQTIDNWCKNGLKHRERYITGRAVLDFMEAEQEKQAETISKGQRKLAKII